MFITLKDGTRVNVDNIGFFTSNDGGLVCIYTSDDCGSASLVTEASIEEIDQLIAEAKQKHYREMRMYYNGENERIKELEAEVNELKVQLTEARETVVTLRYAIDVRKDC